VYSPTLNFVILLVICSKIGGFLYHGLNNVNDDWTLTPNVVGDRSRVELEAGRSDHAEHGTEHKTEDDMNDEIKLITETIQITINSI
jgi:hypothetical protein